MHRVAALASAVLLGLAGLAAACSRPETSKPAPVEAPAPGTSASSPSGIVYGSVCPDPEAEHWDRWEDSDTGASFYVAPRGGMPAAVAWEDCGADGPLDAACMREATLPPSTHTHMFGAVVDTSLSGTPIGVFGRRCPDWSFILIAEVQGSVLTALAQRRSSDARRARIRDLAQGRWVATVRGGAMHGVFGGEVGSGAPRHVTSVRELADSITTYASGEYVVVQGRELLRWDGQRVAVPWPNEPGNVPLLSGQYVLYTGWRKGARIGLVWDSHDGERTAVQMRETKVLRMATDGRDIAFIGQSARRELLGAAPFPGQAQHAAKELLTLAASHGDPIVGCGMVAIRTGMQEVTVARIADGKTWRVHSREKCSLWCLDPLALSCEELFVESYGPQWTMTRIRLERP